MSLIKSVVKSTPREVIIEVIKDTIEIQMNGGMPRVDAKEDEDMLFEQPTLGDNSKKLKTAGGVFLTFLKKHPCFTKDMKKKLAKVEKVRRRESRLNNSLINGLSLNRGIEINVEDLDQ